MLFLKFCLVGCSNAAVTLSSFYFFHNILEVNYLVSSVFGYSLGILNSFTWNKLWAFKMRNTNIKKELAKFLAVNLIGLGTNSFIMLFLVEIIGTVAFISQIIAVGVVFILNFFLYKFWVFRCPSLAVYGQEYDKKINCQRR